MVQGPRPYVVAAEGRHDMVEVLLPDGSTRQLDVDAFVELVAADVAREGLPKGTPIVLAVPFAGDRYLDLPRKLADRTGLTVWAHSGQVELNMDGGTVTLDVIHPEEGAKGDWIASEPGMAPEPDKDDPDWYGRVVTRAIISALTGRQIGRSALEPGELAYGMEELLSHADQMTTFVHQNLVTGTPSDPLALPTPGERFPEAHAYRVFIHGVPGYFQMPMDDDMTGTSAGPGPGGGSSGARAWPACPRTTGST
ncbi:lonely Cys domain-containing protein [Streptomyces sp. M19]